MRSRLSWTDGMPGALVLAATVLGLVDAASALWASRGVAPAATVPLCLTAPPLLSLAVLLPAAPVVALACRGRNAAVAARAASLLGVAAALGALRVIAPIAAAWRDAGAATLAALVPALALPVAVFAGVLGGRAAARRLERTSVRWRARLVAGAALLQLASLAGVVWQWRREGRGLERDLLAELRASATADVASADTASSRGGTSSASRPARRDRVPSPIRDHAPPANLVLITIDTLRADHLTTAHMPRASALAALGTRFSAAFASSSWTLPAMASLMTGRPASRHGAGIAVGVDPLARTPLPPGVPTLATVLERAGFITRAVVTNPYLGLGYGLGAGFASFENVTMESEAVLTLQPTVSFWVASRVVPSLAIRDRGDAVTRRAARFLATPPPGRFFLWLHYVDPHAPYDGATRSFRDDLLAGRGTGSLPRMAQLRAGELRPDAAGRARIRAAYARAVRAADHEVGAVLALLERHDLASRTLVVLTADHGEELWDHGGVEHGHTLYDEVVRVPLVLRCPGCGPVGAVVEAPVGISALAATVLDLLGVAPGDRSEAHLRPAAGFRATLRDEPFVPAPVVSENLLFAEDRVALRTARHTYIAWPNGKEELYDRSRDPDERRDLAARRALVRRHRELLATSRDGRASADAPSRAVDRMAREPASKPDADRTRDAPRTSDQDATLRARTRRALAALGYVE
jgi:arylsulfatase A-like enzyme